MVQTNVGLESPFAILLVCVYIHISVCVLKILSSTDTHQVSIFDGQFDFRISQVDSTIALVILITCFYIPIYPANIGINLSVLPLIHSNKNNLAIALICRRPDLAIASKFPQIASSSLWGWRFSSESISLQNQGRHAGTHCKVLES